MREVGGGFEVQDVGFWGGGSQVVLVFCRSLGSLVSWVSLLLGVNSQAATIAGMLIAFVAAMAFLMLGEKVIDIGKVGRNPRPLQ